MEVPPAARGGRGRIAQVLKEARASLKEPSRPHTPASLDARTAMSLDGAMSRAERHDADRSGRGINRVRTGGSGNQQPDIWVNENYYSNDNDNSEADTDGYASLGDSSAGAGSHQRRGSARNSADFVYGLIAEDLRQSIGNGNGSRRNSAESESISQNVFGMTPSSSADEMTTVKGTDITSGKSNTLQLMICDLKDSFTAVDNEMSVSRRPGDVPISASGEQSLMSILSGMTQPIDRLAKHIRSGAKVAPGVQKEIDGVLQSAKRTLMRIVNDVNNNGGESISLPDASRQACRHLLKLYLSLLAQVATSTLSADVARVIMRTSKALYLIDAAPRPSNGDNNQVTQDGGGAESNDGLSEDAGDEATEHRGGGLGAGSGRGTRAGRNRKSNRVTGEEQMLQGGGDLLLELLQQTWTRLPSDLYRELTQVQAAGSSGESAERDRDVEGKASGTDDGLPSHLDNPMYLLLEGGVFAAGIVRSYCSSSVNVKRLVHLGAVETIVTGMRVTASSVDVIDKAQKKKLRGDDVSRPSASSSSSELIPLVTSQLCRAMEQTTATLRAFTLEKQGRAKLLEQGALALLCRLTVHSTPASASSRVLGEGPGECLYKPSPELVLNCVRATAKLSLLEPFRAQLNQKEANLSHISALIVREDTLARSTGADSDMHYRPTSSTASWPQWYTWPLLSRVCFTLANLTTSNDANRHTIALVYEGVMPLLRLLGRSGLRLRQFARTRRQRRAELLLLDQSLSFDSDTSHAAIGKAEEVASPFAEAEDEDEGDGSDDGYRRGTSGDSGHRKSKDAAATAAAAAAAELEVSDAAVKMLRLVANLAIEAKVGAAVASDLTALNVVGCLLADHVQDSRAVNAEYADSEQVDGAGAGADLSSEELLLNAVAACTNISYYACIQTDKYSNMVLSTGEERAVLTGEEDGQYVLATSAEEHRALFNMSIGADAEMEVSQEKLPLVYLCRMASHLASCLFHVNDEVVLEAARALGNLTRLPHVLQGMTSSRTDEALILLMGHRSMEVVAAVAGTLVNLSAHPEARRNLLERTAVVDSLAHALRRSSMRHITTSVLVCQVLHNLFSSALLGTSTTSAGAGFNGGYEEVEEEEEGLVQTLSELVDLAAEMEEREDDKYAVFARIGGAVRAQLEERQKHETEGRSPQRRREEKGV